MKGRVVYQWLVALALIHVPLFFQSAKSDGEDIRQRWQWVEQTYNAMDLDQKIGQLFMVRAFSKGDKKHEESIEYLIRKHHIGGLCFFQGNPKKQVELTNRYQSMSRLPMLVSIDAEWGLGMRFKDRAISFPRQMTMGAIRDNQLIYQFGAEVAKQLKAMGIHINFAPVVDVNNNPANPVINDRSFGESRKNVTAKGYAYMKGLQDNGVLACAKHFPGHGDTEVDSHKDLPLIKHSLSRLDSLEMYPFKILSQYGIAAMMIAHLEVPTLEAGTGVPTTLSYKTVTDKLKKEIGFDGLIITDALDMKGVTKNDQSGVLEVKAFQAGNDILLLSENVSKAKSKIKEALESEKIPMSRLEESVKKILHAKYDVGLTHFKPLESEKIYNQIITSRALGIKGSLYEHALTCVKDEQGILPLEENEERKIGALSLGVGVKTVFQKRLEAYGQVTTYTASHQLSKARADGLFQALAEKDLVVIGLHDYNKRPKGNHGIGSVTIELIRRLARNNQVILVGFGSPYVIRHFADLPTIVHAYENDEIAQDFCAQALFGVFDIEGMLPVEPTKSLPIGSGKIIKKNGRLGYVIPEVVGMDSDSLEMIDSLANDMIKRKAAPGCQVLIARRGKVVFHRAYGYHDYNKGNKVRLHDIYDIASITKVAATTLALMKLYDDGKIDLRAPLKKYFPEMDTTNKASLTIQDIMAHHASLAGWIPFYESTKSKTKRLSGKWYRKTADDSFNIIVAKDLYLRKDYFDTIFQRIIHSELREKKDYRYSDLGFYIFDRLVHRLTGQRLDQYCEDNFYDPMGLRHIGFNPLENGKTLSLIPPTEEDSYFRTQKIQGHVHDMGAAMQGGVAGHAGLFSNAHDVATIFQMLINHGSYAGKKYFNPKTVDTFTQRHPRSTRRGLGFDMKELNKDKTENMSSLASRNTFGHLGFTGTCAWADPDEELIVVFLSNRTYPSMRNNKLHKINYRPKVHSIAYKSLIN